MATIFIAAQILLLLFFPYISLKLGRLSNFKNWISPIILCYAFGILLRNLNLIPLDDKLSTSFSEITIIFAIPLLLYSTNVFKWIRHTRPALLSFGLSAVASIIGCFISYYVFRPYMANANEVSAMMAGLYIGGTPNVQAIGLAIKTDQNNIILVNTADIFVGGLYLLFLTSVARTFFGLFLPHYKETKTFNLATQNVQQRSTFNPIHSIKAMGLTIIVIGLAIGSCYIVYGDLSQTSFIMVALTTFGIAASFLPFVKKWESTFATAEYLLLIFSVALGMLADFSAILENGMLFIAYDALILLIAVGLHSLFAYYFKIDRDTFLITSIAALYGTPFVAQIGTIIGNQKVIFSGVLMSLLGYMVGNYLGLGVAWVLQ